MKKKKDTAKLAARLAPLEEQDLRAARKQVPSGNASHSSGIMQDHGALIVDNDNLKLPKGFIGEYGGGKENFFSIEPVVIVIVCVMLIFIAFIAWKITEMPVTP